MSIIYTRFLPALIVLWLFCFCARADSPGSGSAHRQSAQTSRHCADLKAPVSGFAMAGGGGGLTGFYYEDDLDHPLAGALIALYKADNNLLVDFTYTRNDGAFALNAPSTKSKYYVVATRDQFSHKVDLDYDPQTPAQNLLIQHHQPKGWLTRVIGYVGNKLVEVVNLLIGLLLGLGFKVYEDRRKARQVINREIKAVKDSTEEILKKYQSLQQTAKAYGASRDSATTSTKRAEYIGLATEIGSEVEELRERLDANTDLNEAIYTAHKVVGRDSYAAFRTALREIQKLMTEIVADPETILDLPPQDRDKQLEPFQNLEQNNLLNGA